jgi:hypothetical protein
MGRHCGGKLDTFMVRVDGTRQEMERVASTMTTASIDATLGTVEVVSDTVATASGWTWRHLKSWLGLGASAPGAPDRSAPR